jgi:hypothetical protein
MTRSLILAAAVLTLSTAAASAQAVYVAPSYGYAVPAYVAPAYVVVPSYAAPAPVYAAPSAPAYGYAPGYGYSVTYTDPDWAW